MKKFYFTFLMCLILFSVKAQKITVTGQVIDEQSSPLPAITIIEKGTTNGTYTDLDGFYSIEVDSLATLIFVGIGFQKEEILLNGQKTINLMMEEESNSLEDVVVVGYSEPNSRPRRKKGKRESQKVMPSQTNNGYYKDTDKDFNTESYNYIEENTFKTPFQEPLSTLSIDVDRASYSNVRRYIEIGKKPPIDAVRIEEMVNYFDYSYPQPSGEHPFAFNTELSQCPWQEEHKLLKIALQAQKIDAADLPPNNFVFLLDVSGSMEDWNKLPLLKESIKLLVNNLREEDRVAIVVYAGASGVVLNSTSGFNKTAILSVLDNLKAGGSTAGGAGIELAYKIAEENFLENGNNRIILATDGDFNVGISSESELIRLIEKKRETGIYLTCLGFGMGNYKDDNLESLADKGNGNYAYIDDLDEAKKTLVNEFGATMFTVAKDVKIQLEFNPNKVQAYRLIGYENRMMDAEDFDDDTKDAGEMGAGHTVTVLYEIIPIGVESDFIKADKDLKYQNVSLNPETKDSPELMTIKFRYKPTKKKKSILVDEVVNYEEIPWEETSNDFRFATAVTEFALILRESEFKGSASFEHCIEIANNALGSDNFGYRAGFIKLVQQAMRVGL